MRPNNILLSSFFACILTTAAPPSYAGDGPAVDALTDKAAILYDEGVAAYKKSKLPEARASFLAAWSLKKHWQIAASLADCEVELGLYREAAEHMAYFLRAAPKARQTAEARKLYETALSRVGTLTITVDQPGADVAVDGKVIGKTPLEDPVFVEPGAHTLEARLHTQVATLQVDTPQGASRPIALSLKDAQPPPLVVEKRPLWPAIAAGSVAVVAVGVGAGLTAVAGGKRADVNALGTQLGAGPVCVGTPSTSMATNCQTLKNDAASHDTLNKAALGTFVAGGALAVAAAGLSAWWAMGPKDERARKTNVRAAPLVGRGEAGAMLVGAW